MFDALAVDPTTNRYVLLAGLPSYNSLHAAAEHVREQSGSAISHHRAAEAVLNTYIYVQRGGTVLTGLAAAGSLSAPNAAAIDNTIHVKMTPQLYRRRVERHGVPTVPEGARIAVAVDRIDRHAFVARRAFDAVADTVSRHRSAPAELG